MFRLKNKINTEATRCSSDNADLINAQAGQKYKKKQETMQKIRRAELSDGSRSIGSIKITDHGQIGCGGASNSGGWRAAAGTELQSTVVYGQGVHY